MKSKRNFKRRYVIFFSMLFILFASLFVTTTYSKFASKVSKSGDVSVAKWDVSSNMPNKTVNLQANDNTDTYTLTVTNDSEVAAAYSINISNLPYGTLVALDDDDYVPLDTNENSISFSNVGIINADASEKTKTHTLKFRTSPDAQISSDRKVNVSVEFEQQKPQ